MDRYKFRGKRVDNGEEVKGYFRKVYSGSCQIMPIATATDDHQWHNVQPDTVGQYTGQKDKNDAEIYKGSDVLVTWDDGETEQYKVDWSDELWGFCLDTETRLPCSSQIEVIHDKEQQ